MILQYFDVCMFDTLSDVLPLNYLFAADPEHQRKEIEGSSNDNLVILYNVCCVILFHFVSFCFIVYHCVSFCLFLFHLVSCCVSLFDFVALCRIVSLSCRFCNCIRIICVLSLKQQFHLEQMESMKKKVLKMKMKPCLGKMCPFRRCVTGAHQGYCCGRCRLQSGGHGPKCMMILTMKAKENQKKALAALRVMKK